MAKISQKLFEHSTHLQGEWDYLKNDYTNPEKLTYASGKKVWWLCPKAHSYTATVDSRTMKNSSCPYCSNQKVLCGYNDIATTYPEIAAKMVNEVDRHRYTRSSSKKVEWVCTLGHVWAAKISNQSTSLSGCPYCTNQSVLRGFNDLSTTYPSLSQELLDKGEAFTVSKACARKLKWVCAVGHIYTSTVSNRRMGKGCSKCSLSGTSRVEMSLRILLSNEFEVVGPEINHRVDVRWPNSHKLSVDIELAVGINKVIVEYDGVYFHMNRLSKDTEKTILLLGHGYLVIRVREQTKDILLPNLDVSHENLLQIPVMYSEDGSNLADAITEINLWIKGQND